MNNRIWIELDKGSDDLSDEALLSFRSEQCRLANIMLKRLGFEDMEFFVSDKKPNHRYCLIIDSAGQFLELTDRGHWFDLDFIGGIA